MNSPEMSLSITRLHRAIVLLVVFVVTLLAVYLWTVSVNVELLSYNSQTLALIQTKTEVNISKSLVAIEEEARPNNRVNVGNLTGHGNSTRRWLKAELKSKPRLPIPTPKRKSCSGYVLATHFLDQMTAGTVNLLSLQCWASSLHDGVRVVEPFLRDGSHLGFETSLLRNTTLKERSGPKLLDIYNSWSWRCSTESKRFSPLSTWEEFFSDAPRKIVIVGLDCKEEIRQPFYDSALQFSRDNGFEVVGEACMDGKHPLSAGNTSTMNTDPVTLWYCLTYGAGWPKN